MHQFLQQVFSGLAAGAIYASLALELADHAYLLETGYIVTSGSAKALADDPQIRRSYLGY